MTSNSDQAPRLTSLTDLVNETAWDSQPEARLPLLPRSSWQDRTAFLRILVKAKRSLDIAEINAYLD